MTIAIGNRSLAPSLHFVVHDKMKRWCRSFVQLVAYLRSLTLPNQSMKPQEWRAYFEDRGVEKHLIDAYLSYVERLSRKKLPVIFELDHLSSLVGIKLEYLVKMIASPPSFYREFYIPKRRGGKRRILAPYESILSCQRWILRNILDEITIHPAAHGFHSKRSIKTNASEHIAGSALLKMDLKDFFPSIPKSWIINLFKEFGYADNVSYYLASLCCYEESLAQGAATSPALSNLVLRGLDSRLAKLARKCSLRYSRYADDLTFSGESIDPSLSKLVTKIIEEYGLEVNNQKTRLKLKSGARIVTGVSISNGQLSIPREIKRKIKNEFFFIKKFGLLSHLSNRKIKNPNYLHSLLGRISFWIFIEPEDTFALEAKKYIKSIMKE